LSTTSVHRKNIVRLLIEQVKVTVIDNTEKVHVEIFWAGGYQTEADFNRPVGKLEQLSYYQELIERSASIFHEGKQLKDIANILNHEGWQSPKQRSPFNYDMVRSLLARKGILSKKKKRSDNVVRQENELTIRELSEKTQIPEPTLYVWLRKDKLTARRDTTVSHQGVWLIKADEKEIKRLLELREIPNQWIYHSCNKSGLILNIT